MSTSPPLLTLTTDFGTRDAYVAAMKAVILGISPAVRMIDVTHEIAPQDVMEAAFVLRDAAFLFPPGTVHLVVVDPGVGTERRPVAVRFENRFFVGPDNGLFPLLFNGEPPDEAIVLDDPVFWRTPEPSKTFHGRDVFAPAAAHLTAGVPLARLGSRIDSLTPLHWALPIVDGRGIQGWIVHIDRFGNCITNIRRADFEAARQGRPVKIFAGNTIIREIRSTYGEVAHGEPLALFGSNDYLEIAVHGGNASELLGIRKGAPVNVVFI